ncbi:MAG TPA: polymer-forming cytoskeletal protein [Actinomycetota bacterium]|nr:polymer-forming cytoskeletal protein [Actinomycetota bacterium]
MPHLRAVFAVLVAALAFGGTATALAQPSPADEPASPERRGQVVLSGDVSVRRGEDVGELIVLHGSARVIGVVHGDVIVIDGPIEVTGQVSGSVVSLNGPVTVGPNAQILRDVIARDPVTVAEGARIGGRVRQGSAFTFRTPFDVVGPFAAWLAVAVSTLILGAVLVVFVPRGADAVAATAIGSPLVSAGLGVAVVVGVPVVGLLALASLVGLPLGAALLLGLLLLYSVGYTWSVVTVGRLIWRAPRTPWLALLIGWALVAALSAVPYVGGVVWLLGTVMGLGAMTLAAWRARGGRGRHRPSSRAAEPVVDVGEVTAEPRPMIIEPQMEEEGTGI